MSSMWWSKFINFIKSQLMSACLFNNQCDKTGYMHRALLRYTKGGKALVQSFNCEWNKPLFHGIDFYLKELLKYCGPSDWYLSALSLKWITCPCHFREYHRQNLPMMKFQISSENEIFGKLISTNHNLDSFPIFRDFSNKMKW